YVEIPFAEIPILTQTALPAGTNFATPPWLEQGNPFAIYRGGVYPALYSNNVFIADSQGQTIHRLVCGANGLTTSCTPNPATTDFFVSRDAAFRPVQVINGPGGALYVASRQENDGGGRIYRIVPESFRNGPKFILSAASARALVAMLEEPDAWRR